MLFPKRTYIAQPVPYSNLFSLVILSQCQCDTEGRKILPRVVSFPGDCTGLPGALVNPGEDSDGTARVHYKRRPDSCISSHPEVCPFHFRPLTY